MIKKNVISVFRVCLILVMVGLVVLSFNVNAFDMSMVKVDLVNQNPDPARNGEIVEVRVGVQNMGAKDSKNVILEFLESYPFTMIGDSVKEIGVIKAYQGYQGYADIKIIKFDLLVDKNAPAGTHNLDFLVTEEGSNIIHKTKLSIDVSSRELAEIIHIDKTNILPGKQNTLKFTINNLGNAPINDVVFSWVNEDKVILPVGGDNTKHIRHIEVGESVDVTYEIMADSGAVAGLYELSLNLKFSDLLTGVRELNTFAGIYVGGETDFHVSLNEFTNSQIVFTVANTGSNPARSVSVSIPQQQGWSVTSPTSRIIGNLNTGDYTVASFNVQQSTMQAPVTEERVGESVVEREGMRQAGVRNIDEVRNNNVSFEQSSQDNTIKVVIEYTDTKGSRENMEKEIVVSSAQSTAMIRTNMTANTRMPQQSKGFFSKYYLHLIIGMLLVLLFVYYDYKKKRRMNEKLTLKQYLKF